MLIRSDSAGATYGFAAACRTVCEVFHLGAVIDAPGRERVEVLNTADGSYPAVDSSGATRESTWARRTDQTGGPVEMVDRYPADPVSVLAERLLHEEGGRCRVLTPRTMRRPNVLEDSTPSRSLTATAEITL